MFLKSKQKYLGRGSKVCPWYQEWVCSHSVGIGCTCDVFTFPQLHCSYWYNAPSKPPLSTSGWERNQCLIGGERLARERRLSLMVVASQLFGLVSTSGKGLIWVSRSLCSGASCFPQTSSCWHSHWMRMTCATSYTTTNVKDGIWGQSKTLIISLFGCVCLETWTEACFEIHLVFRM